jgi:predicted DNA-binding transcriptional regulator YafY
VQIHALATLHQTFVQKTMPYSQDIQELLSSFIACLPAQQQKALIKQKRLFNIDLRETTDYGTLDEKTKNEVDRAILCGQQLEFSYKSPRQGQERRHVIEPEPLRIKDGHVYLYGWSLDYEKVLQFRLDYIVPSTAKMLHTSIVHRRPYVPSYVLRYHLTPTIARNSVSQHFPHPQQTIERHPDGSATVTTQITNLFEARRILLSYGEHCTIDSPPELVEDMRSIAESFAKKYLSATE